MRNANRETKQATGATDTVQPNAYPGRRVAMYATSRTFQIARSISFMALLMIVLSGFAAATPRQGLHARSIGSDAFVVRAAHGSTFPSETVTTIRTGEVSSSNNGFNGHGHKADISIARADRGASFPSESGTTVRTGEVSSSN